MGEARGRTFVFKRSEETSGVSAWSPSASLASSSGNVGERFASSVSVFGDQLGCGAPGSDIGCAPDSGDSRCGAVFLYARADDDSDWNETQVIAPVGGGQMAPILATLSRSVAARLPSGRPVRTDRVLAAVADAMPGIFQSPR